MGTYNSAFGHRPLSAWGDGDIPSPYAEGDVVFVPDDCAAILSGRLESGPGVHRVVAAFSIGEGAEWYFRLSPMRPTGRGDRWTTDTAWTSDRLHQIPGKCDYTAGWTLLFTSAP